ncbi:MAG TPA: hypothetical protein VMZ11_08880 [Mycobacteriales bacterium]|nr:hypothetical protein [Mycobacteriales bacterium]
MTLDTFAPAPAVEAPAEEAAGSSSRRTALVAGGVAAALALGGGGYVLLSGGSDSTTTAGPSTTLPHRFGKPAVKKPTAPVVKKPVVKVPPTSTVPLGRDPFHALYVQPVLAAASVATGGTTTPVTPTTSGGSTGGTTTPTTPTTTTPKVYKLVLTRVYGSGKDMTGVFSVGGRSMVAKVGSVFGPTGELKLLSLSQSSKGVWTAALQVGDSEPVDASKGETLYVR